MFERLTDRARRVVVLAQEEARMLSHGSIGTEHILLALIREHEGVAAMALQRLGVSLEAVRAQLGEPEQGGEAPIGSIPFGQRAKKVLELSLREALQLGHSYIGTEHILLGLIREGQGLAATVLQQHLDGDLDRVRREVIRLLSGVPIKAPPDKKAPERLPIRLTHRAGEPPTVLFDGKDITRFIAADGLQIDYDTREPVLGPKVTITLATGKFDFDFDIELLERLLADARGRAAVD